MSGTKWRIRHGENTFEFQPQKTADGTTAVQVDQHRLKGHVETGPDGSAFVVMNGRRTRVFVDRDGDVLWVSAQGKTWRFVRQVVSSQTRGSEVDSQLEINSPMTGKVVRVEVQTGDAVVSGQVMAVVEAMKMEYALKAAKPGLVAEVLCRAGQQVDMGQALIRLEAGSERPAK